VPDPADFQDHISHIRLLNRDTEAFIDASAEDIFCWKVRDKKIMRKTYLFVVHGAEV
jgi:hypothetical protein